MLLRNVTQNSSGVDQKLAWDNTIKTIIQIDDVQYNFTQNFQYAAQEFDDAFLNDDAPVRVADILTVLDQVSPASAQQ